MVREKSIDVVAQFRNLRSRKQKAYKVEKWSNECLKYYHVRNLQILKILK